MRNPQVIQDPVCWREDVNSEILFFHISLAIRKFNKRRTPFVANNRQMLLLVNADRFVRIFPLNE